MRSTYAVRVLVANDNNVTLYIPEERARKNRFYDLKGKNGKKSRIACRLIFLVLLYTDRLEPRDYAIDYNVTLNYRGVLACGAIIISSVVSQ
jgi:hypothetical protein